MSPSAIEASCPACGAPVTFKTGSSIVVVCEFCHSVVARGDRKLEDLGKVAEVGETGSPLQVGLGGIYHGVPFQLTGRAQLAHPAGGVWDEWYAAFADGRWGWLAEAQGRFYMTFEQGLQEQALIPPFETLNVGEPVGAIRSSVPFMVAEIGEARAVAAEGEIPYKLVPGEVYYYADLSGPGGAFATIDYSQQQPLLFIGREVQFAELGFPPTVIAPERKARQAHAIQLSCPQCGGPLELRAPDRTERVTCPNCGSLLDVNRGKLEFLNALRPPKVAPLIPIGAVGDLFGARYTVIGFMQRSVQFEGVRYYWQEYLLYDPHTGFRWLVFSDENWSFVESVPPGEVIESNTKAHKKGDTASFRGERYKIYQSTTARVEEVWGEFYWKVTVGEQARATDYIHPPRMLSKEDTIISKEPKSVRTGEVNWSLGTYLKPQEVEKAFNLRGLPRPSKVAWNQPFPHKKIYKYWLLLALAVIVVGLIFQAITKPSVVYEDAFTLDPPKPPEKSAWRIDPGKTFQLEARKNIHIVVTAEVDNSWAYFVGDLVNVETGEAQPFDVAVENYHGVEDGEAWTEGGKESDTYLSAMDAGTYTLALEVEWEKIQQPLSAKVRIEQNVPRLSYMLIALAVISIIPVFIAIRHFSFEKRRWEDSDYSPYSS